MVLGSFERLLTQKHITMNSKFYLPYLAPDVEVVAIAVEHGFMASSNVEDPTIGDEQDW